MVPSSAGTRFKVKIQGFLCNICPTNLSNSQRDLSLVHSCFFAPKTYTDSGRSLSYIKKRHSCTAIFNRGIFGRLVQRPAFSYPLPLISALHNDWKNREGYFHIGLDSPIFHKLVYNMVMDLRKNTINNTA
ncbi:uncharacterized protein LOC131997027 [Stomoxys calcitrans]|uniref:uncharacterized protein LOC131997027 n=1 Tax=Stomoxys calcitrans TaxID=35570 RepID=UPI0027E35500|nr:uncharacterized protein LOC131997027 [Stomoxys calcitrans]